MNEKSRPWPLAVRCLCAAVCIVATASGPSTRAEDGLAIATIARWDFGSDEDAQADRWPDGWTRLKDTRHPGFIPIQIDKKSVMGVDTTNAERIRRLMAKLYLGLQNQRSPWEIIPETIPAPVEKFVEGTLVDPYLRIDMDGSSAEIYSPKIAVDDDSYYGLQVEAMSSSDDFLVKAQLRFLDRSGQVIYRTETGTLAGDSDWRRLQTEGAYDAPSGIASIQAVLVVEPRNARATKAVIGFDRIRLVQMPKIRLQLDRVVKIYRPGEDVDVHLFASGLRKGITRVDLFLYDHDGNLIASESKELPNSQKVYTSTQLLPQGVSRWEGECDWQLPDLPPGYYEIMTQLKRNSTVFLQDREYFAVVPPAPNPNFDHRFGWSFDERILDWKRDDLIKLLREGGSGIMKLPIWFDPNDPVEQDRLCTTIDRIQSIGVRCVGIIDRPIPKRGSASAQNPGLEDPSIWQPQLEPVFRTICMYIVDFQIGRDQDTQYGSNPRYEEMLAWIKKILRRYGTETTITLPRNTWLNPAQSLQVDRWQWSIEDTISESEWPQMPPDPKAVYPDWTCITPASAEKYSLPIRTQDLAARMIASIRPWTGRTSTGWVRKPFSGDVGFLDPDGSPREMFLPYRMLLDAIKKREFVGEIPMDGGSRNALLVSDTDSCVIVWSPSPVTEQLYLGDNLEAIDVWGRRVDIDKIETPFGPEHRIQLNKWPLILRGVDTKIAMWRIGLAMDQQRLDSLVGLPQKLLVRFNNPFSFPISGRIELVAPHIFANERESSAFDVGASSEVSVPITVMLRPDATSQETPIRVIITLNTSPTRRFSMSEIIRIGNDEVDFQTSYRISDIDELWLDIDAINHTTNTASFDCQLFIPDRRNERIQFPAVESQQTRTVVLPKASELMYKTLRLRCSQIGTRRILNYRIVIEPESTGQTPDTGESSP
jgi:hypothetical protein